MSDQQWTLSAIVDQLKSCKYELKDGKYECEAGSLEDNVAFQALEEMAKPIERSTGIIQRDARAQVIMQQVMEYCERVNWGRGKDALYWLEVELIIADALKVYDFQAARKTEEAQTVKAEEVQPKHI